MFFLANHAAWARTGDKTELKSAASTVIVHVTPTRAVTFIRSFGRKGYQYEITQPGNRGTSSGSVLSPYASKNGHTVRVTNVRVLGSMLLEHDQQALVILTSYASSLSTTGFCGSGIEDYVELLKVGGQKLRLIDAVQVQSCLKNVELSGDSDADRVAAVKLLPQETELRIDWFDNGSGSEEKARYRIASRGFIKL